ncbi:MAG: EAL domain-containing protein [Gallionella sp.]|jgi:diguanylate cyclase (GGDEF)-like protein/PAS domain S-box-containing protein
MKKRLSFLIPLILVIVSLTSSYLMYLQEDRADKAAIEKAAITEATLQMGGLQNGLYNRLTAGDGQQALLSLSLAATYPTVRTLMLVDEQHRVLMANRYNWKGELAGTLSSFSDAQASQVVGSGAGSLAFSASESTLLQGYFPLIIAYKQGGLEKTMGLLYVEYDISHELRKEEKSTIAQALIFAAITLFASGFIGMLLHFLVTRRVNLLTSVSSRLAAGDYTARTALKGDDELSELGRSFDVMAQRMTENIARQEQQRAFLAEAQKIGHFGSWEHDLLSGQLTWSDEIFRLFEIDQANFVPSYEAFLNIVHPEDRERVSQAYCNSLLDRQPYQITHRLLTPDGRVKWVEERCSNDFDAGAHAVRSVGTVQDVTEREETASQLRIAAVAFETQEAIMVTDKDANIIRVNRAFEESTGYSEAEVVGKNPRMLSSGRHDDAFYADMWEQIKVDGMWAGELWDRRKSGEVYPKWLTITAVKSHGEISHYVAVFLDITERKRAEEEIHNLAYFDPLTNLPNRRLLLDRMRIALAQSARSKNCGALMFIDLDYFKVLNDTKGHEYGDKMLIEVAHRLAACVRDADSVARFGGDEFVVLLEGLSVNQESAATQASTIAEKIRESLSQTYVIEDYAHESSPSIGVVLFCGHEVEINELFKRADLAMYQAKECGRNMVRFFEPKMQAVLESRTTMEHALRQALSNGELELFYQVQTNQDQVLLGAEVLLRWFSPELGMVSPAQFIPLAEQSKLILPIGRWVMESACARLKAWETHPVLSTMHLAVNVSPVQFHQSDFVHQVKEIVAASGVNPKRLELELTENLVLDDVEEAIKKMAALKAIGVRFSMDDFGTGYSSLQYIKRLPIDQLKIDQSFVRDILTDPGDAMMVQTIAEMARNFGYEVIAEGVEEQAQLQPLIDRGCDTFQGYLFSRPVSLAEFEKLIDSWVVGTTQRRV